MEYLKSLLTQKPYKESLEKIGEVDFGTNTIKQIKTVPRFCISEETALNEIKKALKMVAENNPSGIIKIGSSLELSGAATIASPGNALANLMSCIKYLILFKKAYEELTKQTKFNDIRMFISIFEIRTLVVDNFEQYGKFTLDVANILSMFFPGIIISDPYTSNGFRMGLIPFGIDKTDISQTMHVISIRKQQKTYAIVTQIEDFVSIDAQLSFPAPFLTDYRKVETLEVIHLIKHYSEGKSQGSILAYVDWNVPSEDKSYVEFIDNTFKEQLGVDFFGNVFTTEGKKCDGECIPSKGQSLYNSFLSNIALPYYDDVTTKGSKLSWLAGSDRVIRITPFIVDENENIIDIEATNFKNVDFSWTDHCIQISSYKNE